MIMIEVVADPTVEVFASRDVDSFLLPRCEKICMRYTIQYNTCKYKIHKTLIVLYHNVPLRERAAVGQWLEDSEKQVVNQTNPLSWQSGNLISGEYDNTETPTTITKGMFS